MKKKQKLGSVATASGAAAPGGGNLFLQALVDASENLQKMGCTLSRRLPEIESAEVVDFDENSLNVRLKFDPTGPLPDSPDSLVSIRLEKFYKLVQDAYLLGAEDAALDDLLSGDDSDDDDDTSIN